ncbi:MAG: hypothetical protein MJE77_07550 [Proteobacteria bacterium]|nr:hypothetical protein [Pseudomonadota bacterium]
MARRLAIASLIAALIVLFGILTQSLLFQDTDIIPIGRPVGTVAGTVPDTGSSMRPIPGFLVTAVEGAAKRRQGGAWRPLRSGEELAIDDAIRTGERGHVSLKVGAARVELDADAEIVVTQIAEAVSWVELGRGRVEASVPGDGAMAVGVVVAGTDSTAQTSDGEFAVLKTGQRQATVAVKQGRVALTGRNATISVAAGKQAVLRHGQPPAQLTSIPPSLFLKIARHHRVQRARHYVIRGRTAPGSVISVNGVPVPVSEVGEFTARVGLREGDNQIRVEGRDALGRRAHTTTDVTRDSTAPEVEAQVQWSGEK